MAERQQKDWTDGLCVAKGRPEPVSGAEWVLDSPFNAAEEVLQNPSLKDTYRAAIENGIEVVMLK